MTLSVARQISLTDLLATLDSVRNSERCGVPVNIRLHWQTAGELTSEAAIKVAFGIVRHVFIDASLQWRLRSGPDLIHLLGIADSGQTALITLALDAASGFSMTVTGNHGVAAISDCWLSVDEQDVARLSDTLNRDVQNILDQITKA